MKKLILVVLAVGLLAGCNSLPNPGDKRIMAGCVGLYTKTCNITVILGQEVSED